MANAPCPTAHGHEPGGALADGNAQCCHVFIDRATVGTPGLAIAWGPWLERVHRLHGSLSNATGPLDHGPNQHRLLLVLKSQWNT